MFIEITKCLVDFADAIGCKSVSVLFTTLHKLTCPSMGSKYIHFGIINRTIKLFDTVSSAEPKLAIASEEDSSDFQGR